MKEVSWENFKNLAVAVITETKKNYLDGKINHRDLNGLYFWSEIVMGQDLRKLKSEFKKQLINKFKK